MQKAHTLLFSCSQSVLAAGIQQNQPGTEQNASDNITQPVHAGNQPPHNHKGGECRQQGKKNVQNSRSADAAVQLHHGGRHHAQHQQRGGGRIRNFQRTTNQNRPLVDGKELKQEVESQNRQVEPAKE